jgi:UPF0271 protein
MAETRPRIDLNLDLGEGFGVWSRDCDEDELFALATSVNLACGFHAGDPGRMRAAVEAAGIHGRAVGAHPGFPDLVGFGRRPLRMSPSEVKDCITYQLGALEAFLRASDLPLHHVKLHGELATQCNSDEAAATAYVEAVRAAGKGLPIYANRRSEVWNAAVRVGVPVVAEFYADLHLRRDGSRDTGAPSRHGRHPEIGPALVRARVRDFLVNGSVDAADGGRVEVVAGTISVNTDGAVAVEMARAVRAGVGDAGFELSSDVARRAAV